MSTEAYRENNRPNSYESKPDASIDAEAAKHGQLDTTAYPRRQKVIDELALSFVNEPQLEQPVIDGIYAQYPVREDDSLPESPSKSQLIDLVRSKGGIDDAKTLAIHEVREMASHHTLDDSSTIELANLALMLTDINNEEKRYTADEKERKKVVELANTAIRLLRTVDMAEGLARQDSAQHRINAQYAPSNYAMWDKGQNPDQIPKPTPPPETEDDLNYTKNQLRARENAAFLERDKVA